MGSLSGAEVIGGAVVKVGADLTELRAGRDEAKQIVAELDRMKVTAGLGGGSGGQAAAASAGASAANASAGSGQAAQAANQAAQQQVASITANYITINNSLSSVANNVNNVANVMNQAAAAATNASRQAGQQLNAQVQSYQQYQAATAGAPLGQANAQVMAYQQYQANSARVAANWNAANWAQYKIQDKNRAAYNAADRTFTPPDLVPPQPQYAGPMEQAAAERAASGKAEDPNAAGMRFFRVMMVARIAEQVIKSGAMFAEASDTESHPERIVRRITEGSRYGADDYITRNSSAIASRQAMEQKAAALESLPLIGAGATIEEAITGSRAKNKEEIAKLEAANQAHQKALQVIDSVALQRAELGGDPRTIAAEKQRQAMAELDTAAAAHPNDRAIQTAITLQHRLFTGELAPKARAEYEAQAAYVERMPEATNVAIASGHSSARSRSMQAARVSEESILGEEQRASDQKYKAERIAAEQKYNLEMGGANPEQAKKITATYNEDKRRRDAEHEDQSSDFENKRTELARKSSSEIIEADASGKAALLRSSREYYAAEVEERSAHHKVILDSMNDGPAKEAYRREFSAEDKAAGIENQRRLGMEKAGYATQAEVADLRTADKPQQAAAVSLIASVKREIQNATPSLANDARTAGIAEISERLHELTAVRGGGGALESRPGERINDYLDLSGVAQDRKNAEGKLRAEREKQEGDRQWAALGDDDIDDGRVAAMPAVNWNDDDDSGSTASLGGAGDTGNYLQQMIDLLTTIAGQSNGVAQAG